MGLIKVYESDNAWDAQLLCDWLRGDGIAAQVHGGYLSGAAGELPLGMGLSVWIEEPCFKLRAAQLVLAFEQQRQQTPQLRRCSRCDESIDGNFDCCWQCGHWLE